MTPGYPTRAHEEAAAAITEFFAARAGVDAVLLVNSCARGKATPDSCLDMLVLAEEGSPHLATLEQAWAHFASSALSIAALRQAGRYAVVHLDIEDGRYAPPDYDGSAGPDGFELAIGNHLVYAAPLWERGDRLARLRAAWLPYYDEDLRRARLVAIRGWCLDHLDHVAWYVERGLPFQAFDRLYNAFGMFLQALFIARRVYPIAYNKWIHEQIVEILRLSELYEQLPHLFEITDFAGRGLAEKAAALRGLLRTYAAD